MYDLCDHPIQSATQTFLAVCATTLGGRPLEMTQEGNWELEQAGFDSTKLIGAS